MDRGAWQTIVHGVTKSRTQLRDFHFHFTFQRRCLPMKMKTHTYRRHRSIMFICCYCCSVTNLCLTLCNPMNFSTPGFPVLHCLLEFAQTHVHWVRDVIQPSHPLSLPFPLALNLSSIRVFSNVYRSYIQKSTNWKQPKCEYTVLYSKNTAQKTKWITNIYNADKSGVGVRKHDVERGPDRKEQVQTFVGKVMSLLFNKLSRLVITFLSRSKRLLISWLQSPSAVILEPQNIVCHCFPIYLPWSDGTRCHDLRFLNVVL